MTYSNSTTLSDVTFSAVAAMTKAQAEEFDLEIFKDTEKELIVGTIYGQYIFRPHKSGTRVEIQSEKTTDLHVLKDSFVHTIEHLSPDMADTIRWTGSSPEYGTPPNFQFTTVEWVKPLTPSFKRLRLSVPDLQEYTDDAIHFRLVLPPDGLENVTWPQLKPNGSVSWPQGEAKLHAPVYTARKVNHVKGLLDVDVFLHIGGRVTQWLNTLMPGDQVAIIGPGGGGIPKCKSIRLYGDETALPAITRIIETLPGHVKIEASLQAESDFETYPIPDVPGLSVSWISSDRGESLVQSTLSNIENDGSGFLWFAGERSDAETVRKAVKDKKLKPSETYVAAYWAMD